jgi:hypothetical protein
MLIREQGGKREKGGIVVCCGLVVLLVPTTYVVEHAKSNNLEKSTFEGWPTRGAGLKRRSMATRQTPTLRTTGRVRCVQHTARPNRRVHAVFQDRAQSIFSPKSAAGHSRKHGNVKYYFNNN